MTACARCHHQNSSEASRCTACGTGLGVAEARDLASDPSLLIGKILAGKYEILAVLGEGGMGVVYKVRHIVLESRNVFALKVLHPRFSGDERFRKRFLREVELAMGLAHQNIVQIREFGLTDDELLYFTMDWVPGRPLSRVIREERSLPPERILRIARALLRGLSEAHRSGIVHRDLKPDNILLVGEAPSERVKILDFGIAKAVEGEGHGPALTEGGVIGTPKYMSPEQASGEEVDARSDLYSLGVVLYEMATGRVPFSRPTARAILMAHLTAPPPPLREGAADVDVPPWLESFIFSLLAKDAAGRPASAEDCLALLEGLEKDDTPPTVPLTRTDASPVLSRRRRLLPLSFAVIAGAGAMFSLAFFFGEYTSWLPVPGAEARSDARRGSLRAAGPARESNPRGGRSSTSSEPDGVELARGAREASEAVAENSRKDSEPVPRVVLYRCLVCNDGNLYDDGQFYLNKCPVCQDFMTAVEEPPPASSSRARLPLPLPPRIDRDPEPPETPQGRGEARAP